MRPSPRTTRLSPVSIDTHGALMRTHPSVLGVFIFILCVAMAGACQNRESPAPPVAQTEYIPTATIKDLMLSVIDPSADVVWLSVTTVVDDKGLVETVPKSDDDWTEGASWGSHTDGGGQPPDDSRPASRPAGREIRNARRRARTGGDGRADREGSRGLECEGHAPPRCDGRGRSRRSTRRTATRCSSSEKRLKRPAKPATSNTGIPTRSSLPILQIPDSRGNQDAPETPDPRRSPTLAYALSLTACAPQPEEEPSSTSAALGGVDTSAVDSGADDAHHRSHCRLDL